MYVSFFPPSSFLSLTTAGLAKDKRQRVEKPRESFKKQQQSNIKFVPEGSESEGKRVGPFPTRSQGQTVKGNQIFYLSYVASIRYYWVYKLLNYMSLSSPFSPGKRKLRSTFQSLETEQVSVFLWLHLYVHHECVCYNMIFPVSFLTSTLASHF